jgi:hypothetical protein
MKTRLKLERRATRSSIFTWLFLDRPVTDSHQICDQTETSLQEGIEDVDVNIHVGPLGRGNAD